MSTMSISPFLRRAMLADAAATAATALLLLAAAPFLATPLGLPLPLLIGAGVALLPFALWVAWVGMRTAISRRVVQAVVWCNAAWVAASLLLVLTPALTPTTLGILFVLAQAVAVLALTEFQWMGLRRADR